MRQRKRQEEFCRRPLHRVFITCLSVVRWKQTKVTRCIRNLCTFAPKIKKYEKTHYGYFDFDGDNGRRYKCKCPKHRYLSQRRTEEHRHADIGAQLPRQARRLLKYVGSSREMASKGKGKNNGSGLEPWHIQLWLKKSHRTGMSLIISHSTHQVTWLAWDKHDCYSSLSKVAGAGHWLQHLWEKLQATCHHKLKIGDIHKSTGKVLETDFY